MRTTFHYPESPYGQTYADVITKISRMDSLPNYLSYGAPFARASRAQGAPPLSVFLCSQTSKSMRLNIVRDLVKQLTGQRTASK